tara:strand:+ start:65 stop:1171 length:1107 start_codon:yes stop_codon:yes gene_type:complete
MSRKNKENNYQDYLRIDDLLNLQNPLSEKSGMIAHEEMLFIITHQVYELWFKQILYELDSILTIFQNDYIVEKEMGVVNSRVLRIIEIQKILLDQITVLETMTPLDFLEFRDLLVPASGFQSVQFRLLEIKMGLKSSDRIFFEKQSYKNSIDSSQKKILSKAEKNSSLFDGVNNWLNRMPFLDFEGFKFWDSYQKAVSQSLQNQKNIFLKDSTMSLQEKKQLEKVHNISYKNFIAIFDNKKHNVLVKNGKRRLSYKAMQASLLIFLYRDEPVLHLPFNLLTNLIDMEKYLTSWRYLHSQMALRMIGKKIGTGGSPGYSYLKTTLENQKIFSDFMDLTSYFLPRSKLPKLPRNFQKNLGFYYARLEDNK